MDEKIVIARADRGQPLVRIVLGESKTCFHLAAREALSAIDSGNCSPIGFPRKDVFSYKSITYEELAKQWDEFGKTEDETWRQLTHYYR